MLTLNRRLFLRLLPLPALALLGIRPSAGDEPIVLSFVHPRGRIDVGRSDLKSMEAHDHVEFYDPETKETERYPDVFGVTLCFSERVRVELKALTTNIVDEELKVIAGCEVIVSPVVREPLGNNPCFSISAYDRDELEEMIEKLENASGKRCNGMS